MSNETPLSDNTRKQRLAQAIQSEVVRGARVETQADFSAVLRFDHRINHVLHLILTIVTVGIWSLVWLTLGIVNMTRTKAVTLSVDEWGNTLRQEVR